MYILLYYWANKMTMTMMMMMMMMPVVSAHFRSYQAQQKQSNVGDYFFPEYVVDIMKSSQDRIPGRDAMIDGKYFQLERSVLNGAQRLRYHHRAALRVQPETFHFRFTAAVHHPVRHVTVVAGVKVMRS